MQNHEPSSPKTHAFVVRIWWESGLTRPDGGPLWRGYAQHAASGQTLVFQTLGDLTDFIQSQAGELTPDNPDLGTEERRPR